MLKFVFDAVSKTAIISCFTSQAKVKVTESGIKW